ncbi:hypothetical protein ES703_19160 [subsurface metagenome]
MSTKPQNLPFALPALEFSNRGSKNPLWLYFLLSDIVALHLSRALYKSTLFMQNKPNLLDTQMNINFYPTKDYENKRLCRCVKTNPIQSQYKPNTNPISSKAKMNANAFLQKDYENETAFRPQKNKPNQTQYKANFEGKKMLRVAQDRQGGYLVFCV